MKATTHTDDTMICPSCQAINSRSAFCPTCGAPVGAVATIDPMQRIQAEGFLFRKALEGRPKPIVFLGIWILHLPVFVICVYYAVHLIRSGHGTFDFVFFWVSIGLAFAAGVILFRSTKNYFAVPKRRPGITSHRPKKRLGRPRV